MKKQTAVLFLSITLFLLAALLFSQFVKGLNEAADSVSSVDAIVVLTGGVGRVEEGLRLFSEGKGSHLIISGVEGTSSLGSIFPGKDLKNTVDTGKIVLDVKSRNTIDNALNVKKILEKKGFKSIILVTSNYHMERAYTMFSKSLSKDVRLYRHPVRSPNFKDEEWWGSLKSLKIMTSEFYKYLWFHIWQRWAL